jgi:hypothetical protein
VEGREPLARLIGAVFQDIPQSRPLSWRAWNILPTHDVC